MSGIRLLFLIGGPFGLWIPGLFLYTADAQMPSEFPATTEQACSFGMAKGEPSHACQVPIPAGCLVAHAPGTSKPWTTISKGGKTVCRFDEKKAAAAPHNVRSSSSSGSTATHADQIRHSLTTNRSFP